MKLKDNILKGCSEFAARVRNLFKSSEQEEGERMYLQLISIEDEYEAVTFSNHYDNFTGHE